MATEYDVIVVGARCAGSPTAMLLARQGHRVLVVDRATFPSDTLSTHLMHAPGVAAMQRWGLLGRLATSGCRPIPSYMMDFGPVALKGTPRPSDGVSVAYGPRRTVLDKLLVDAAAEAGAEIREGFTVEELLFDDGRVVGVRGHGKGGVSVSERARVVVGADGRYSRVAQAVGAPSYNEKPSFEAGYYTYWSGMTTDTFEVFVRPDRSFAAIPTHDDLTLVLTAWPAAEAEANRHDIEGNYLKTLELSPEFNERVRAGTRETRFAGTGDLPGFFRKPYGPGWALVGDAGYHKDPCTAQGISDAFRQCELVARGLDDALSGRRSFDDAMAEYQRVRDDAALPHYEFTSQLATLEPPPPEMQQLLGAVAGNQDAIDDFLGVIAGTVPVPAFFAPDNVARIMGNAAAA